MNRREFVVAAAAMAIARAESRRRHAFVTSGDDGTLRTHDALSGRLLRTARIAAGSYNIANGFGVVFMPSLSQGTLCLADRRGGVTRSVHVARSSHDACCVTAA
jgi:hypothetical protein